MENLQLLPIHLKWVKITKYYGLRNAHHWIIKTNQNLPNTFLENPLEDNIEDNNIIIVPQ